MFLAEDLLSKLPENSSGKVGTLPPATKYKHLQAQAFKL